MRKVLFVLLAAACAAATASQASDNAPNACAQRIEQLGKLCLVYAQGHNGEMPRSLSELYYQAYTFDLDVFVCPGNPLAIGGRHEIDAKSGYILSPTAGEAEPRPVVQDRSPQNHGGRGIHVFYSDSTVQWQKMEPAEPQPAPMESPAEEPRHGAVPTQTPPLDVPGVAREDAPAPGWLGTAIVTLTPELAMRARVALTEGVYLVSVAEPGPAAIAGLQPGDIVVRIGRKHVATADAMRTTVRSLLPGTLVAIDIIRDVKRQTIPVVVGMNPPAEADASGRAWMGVKLRAPTAEEARRLRLATRRGAYVTGISRGSPAERAGLRVGDLVLGFDHFPVPGAKELIGLIKAAGPATDVELTVVRQGRQIRLRVTLGIAPPSSQTRPTSDASRVRRKPAPTGRWEWYVNDQHWGHIIFDGTGVTGYDRRGRTTNHGNWSRRPDRRDTIQIRWQTGRWLDTLTFSADRTKLVGKNNAGANIRAEKGK